MISVRLVSKSYSGIEVLRKVSLDINKGEIVSIVGPSGAGKTTLLQIIGTLLKPDTGEIYFGESTPFRLSDNKLAEFRNSKIGFVFQFHHLLPEFTAIENVCMPALIKGVKQSVAIPMAKQLLERLGLSHRMEHKPSQMSGGEQQRVAIARSMINQPDVILADEPSGNLDSKNKQELHSLFLELRKELGQTFVIVTHDAELAAMSDRVIFMKDGVISYASNLSDEHHSDIHNWQGSPIL